MDKAQKRLQRIAKLEEAFLLEEQKKKRKEKGSMFVGVQDVNTFNKHFEDKAESVPEGATPDGAIGGEGSTTGECADCEGGGMSESVLTESSWTFESKEFEDGYYLECRWDKYNGYEVVGGYAGTDGMVNDDYHRSYSTKEAAMAQYKRLCKRHERLHESLLMETKRYVRRYYIRPQEVFCSNKAEILKALIDIDTEDCTVYTLNNLGDEKDVTKLTNKDIIYYYEDEILYDKNHVKVMDYDLYIKHEENRDEINPNQVSDARFDDVYDDRMTDQTELEEATNMLGQEVDDFDAYGYRIHNVPEYAKTKKFLVARYSEDYEDLWFYGAWDNEDDAMRVALEIPRGKFIKNTNIEENFEVNEFDQDFDDVNAYGECLKEGKSVGGTCCICGEEIEGYGNNAEPYKSGRCCDACNLHYVIPMRLDAINMEKRND